MSGTADPAELLEVARRLCGSVQWSTTAWATRAVALLVRQSVEMRLTQFWEVASPGVALVARRTQFLLLHDRLPSAAVAEAHATWSQLSHACHHRVFDLEPSLSQARQWIDQAERFGTALREANVRTP
jgi:hypothetical protein